METVTCAVCGNELTVTEAKINKGNLMLMLSIEPCEVCVRNAADGYEPGDDPLDDVPPEQRGEGWMPVGRMP